MSVIKGQVVFGKQRLSLRLIMWQILVIALCLQVTAQAAVVHTSSDCGHLPEKITPEEVNGSHLPWVVRLVYDAQKLSYACLGTLISHRVVLTAAHCAHPKVPLEAHIINCEANKPCSEPRKFLVSKAITHPGYSTFDPSHNDDIALLHLDSDVHDATKVGSHVCLPEKSFSTESLMGSKLVVAGFNIHEKGKPSTSSYTQVMKPLATLTATPVSDETCTKEYGAAFKIHNSHICATGNGKEACYGDAAAPLHSVQGTPSRAVLKGILTIGPNSCANSTMPTIYTNVGAHLQWIKENMVTK